MDVLELPQPVPKKLQSFWATLDDSDKRCFYDLLTDHYIPETGRLAGEVLFAITAESVSSILRDCGLEISITTIKTYRRNVVRYEVTTK